jgi:hypothetical protein
MLPVPVRLQPQTPWLKAFFLHQKGFFRLAVFFKVNPLGFGIADRPGALSHDGLRRILVSASKTPDHV